MSADTSTLAEYLSKRFVRSARTTLEPYENRPRGHYVCANSPEIIIIFFTNVFIIPRWINRSFSVCYKGPLNEKKTTKKKCEIYSITYAQTFSSLDFPFFFPRQTFFFFYNTLFRESNGIVSSCVYTGAHTRANCFAFCGRRRPHQEKNLTETIET